MLPVRRLALGCAAPLVLLVASGGCRTRPFDIAFLNGDEDFSVPADAAPSDDLSDLGPVPPDYNFPLFDLTIPRENCGAYTIQTTLITHADLLIVQDRSRSMAQGADGTNNPPPGQRKWDLVVEAIEKVVGTTSTVDWGLLLFGNGVQCGVNPDPDVAVAPGSAARIKAVLDGTALAPSTPTALAISNAVAYFSKLNDKHPHYLLVATDGLPTCNNGGGGNNDSTATIAAVRAAAGVGISTFVVGIGTSTGADETLDAMGQAGGVPNTRPGEPANYTVSNTTELKDLLEATALRITPCIYALPAAPPNPRSITIQGRGGVVQRDLTHNNGWDLGDDGMSVQFFGEACDVLKAGAITSVDAIYGCPGD